jgi:purine-binding chemotaxis protein CheW
VSEGPIATRPKAALSRRAPPAEASAREYLAFEVGAEHYALPLTSIREIVRVPVVTEVPRSADHVLGVISVRGAVTTVIDLRIKLHLAATPATHKSRILLVDAGGEVIGLLADGVLQVHRLSDREIELAAALGSEAPAYLHGIGRPLAAARAASADTEHAARSGELLLLLDPVALFRS